MRALVLADFAPYVGRAFSMRLGPASVGSLVLSDARSLGSAPCPSERRESFALLFTSSEREPARQGTYSLGHPDVGEVELFLVPVGPSPEGGMQYEAIFN